MRTDVEKDHPLRATRDHHVPKSKNNGNPNKLIPACFQCNQIKADRFPEQWERYMLRNPRWWEKPAWNEEHRATAAKLPPPEKPKPPPYWQTMRFLKNAQWAKWRPLGKDEPFPIEYDDPVKQAAWESIYKDRKWLLRVPQSPTAGQAVQGSR
jgi:hypothetical protein